VSNALLFGNTIAVEELKLKENPSPLDGKRQAVLQRQIDIAISDRNFFNLAIGSLVAFVALDIPKHKDYFCVYELLVDPQHRRCGFGTAIIHKCHSLAAQGCFKKMCLIPRPIESGGSEEKLRAWYGKLGFIQSPNQSDLVEIVLTNN